MLPLIGKAGGNLTEALSGKHKGNQSRGTAATPFSSIHLSAFEAISETFAAVSTVTFSTNPAASCEKKAILRQ